MLEHLTESEGTIREALARETLALTKTAESETDGF
jgi:hypothetical protein